MPDSTQSQRRHDDAMIGEAARALGVLGGAATAPRILAALCQPDADAAGISRLLGGEPGLAARVLRVANSPFYGATRSIATLDRAIVLLGLDAVRGIAAAACMDRNFLHGVDPSVLDVDAMIRHSIASAAAAEALARSCDRSLAPEAFIGGLLHDLGAAVQARLDPAGLRQFTARARNADPAPAALRHLEVSSAGVAHEDCTAAVLTAWRLPELLADAVRHHHDCRAAPAPAQRLAALVELGHQLAVNAGMGFESDSARGGDPSSALALAGLTADDIARVEADLPDRVRDLQAALSG